jgi:ABC-type branched-subunit amino acid transport system permease subunit
VILLAVFLPAGVNQYWMQIGTLAFVYWVLIAGLDLIIGYAGQLAIGFVGLLAIGAYTASILCEKAGWPAFAALAAAGAAGAFFGFLVGLPSLRLKSFYFAMTTLGFATIVTQVALGWERLTGGGIGLPGPIFPTPLDTPVGFYYLALGMALFATYLLRNVAFSNFGRGLVAVRDAEVAAEAVGVPITRLKLVTFTLSGILAGMAGALFAARQTYITPDAFTFDLSVLFFIAVLIGGRGRIIGPMIGTAILTLLPEIAAECRAGAACLAEDPDATGRGVALRRGPGAGRSGRDGTARDRSRSDRPERQRQDHAPQRSLRLLCGQRWAYRLRRGRPRVSVVG